MTTLDNIRNQTPSASHLVLSFLNIPEFETCEVSTLVKVAACFSIDEAAIRVAIGRLVKQGLVISEARGVYSIGPKGKALRETAQDWKTIENRLQETWDRSWLIVHTAHLGRTNKTALRTRERAFRLRGFAATLKGLWMRPANLKESMDDTRRYLISIGLEREAFFAHADEIAALPEIDHALLWQTSLLEESYRLFSGFIDRSMIDVKHMDDQQLAREYLLLGDAVIKQINTDPLLPAEMMDVTARKALIDHMLQYNRQGIAFWQDFLA